MINVIKAQNYQLRHENGTYYCFLVALIIYIMPICMLIMGNDFLDITGCVWMTKVTLDIAFIISAGMTLYFTIRICAADISDRTISYELNSGKRRLSVYAGRVIASLIWSIFCAFIFIILPNIIITLINDWGKIMPLKDGMTRLFLLLCPVVRMVFIFSALSFVLSDMKYTAIAGILGIVADSTVTGMIDDNDTAVNALSYIFTQMTVRRVMSFNQELDYIDGEDIMVAKEFITSQDIFSLLFFMTIISAAAFFIGYEIFRKKDMR